MPVLTTSRPARRLLAVALYLACLAAAGAAPSDDDRKSWGIIEID